MLPQYRQPRGARLPLLIASAGAASLYGILVGLGTPDFLLPLTLPLLLLALAVIWVLPESERVPGRALEGLFFAFFIAVVLWPDYLAVDIGGLPWITARRVISAPLAVVFLIALSMSALLRREIKAVLAASPVLSRFLIGFVIIQILSIALSRNVPLSIDKLVVAQLYWTLIFFVGCWVFSRPGRAERWAAMLCLMMVPLALLGLWEWWRGQVAWAGRIPSFLKVEDEAVQRILAGGSRAATGKYRVISTFTTPLGFAEYLALITPFLIHFVMGAFRPIVRIAAAFALPFTFFMVTLTDSRLGAAGFLLSFVLYLAAWGVLRWRNHHGSLFGPAVTLAYPLLFAGFIAATFTIGRLRRLVWGGGEHQFSTEAREIQYAQGFDILAGNPIGHGIGMGAERLGYTNLAGVLTIDTYYLLIALEYGLIGFALYYGMLLLGIGKAGSTLLNAREPDRETLLLVPLAISMVVFVVIKSVFSQESNHSIIYMMLAAIMALSARLKARPVAQAGEPQASLAPAIPVRRAG
jgi:hypothetical protein